MVGDGFQTLRVWLISGCASGTKPSMGPARAGSGWRRFVWCRPNTMKFFDFFWGWTAFVQPGGRYWGHEAEKAS